MTSKLTDKVIRSGLLQNLDRVKLLMITQNDILLIDLISRISNGVSSNDLSKLRAVTIENSSSKLYRLYTKGYLTRLKIKSISGGIEYRYYALINQ
jgi:hypothetical protein